MYKILLILFGAFMYWFLIRAVDELLAWIRYTEKRQAWVKRALGIDEEDPELDE